MEIDKSGLLIGSEKDIIKAVEEKEPKKIRLIKKIIERTILSLVAFATFLLTFGLIYLCSNWDYLTVGEIIYHIKSPLKGASESSVWPVIFLCVLPAAVVAVGINILVNIRKKKKKLWRIMTIVLAGVVLVCNFYSWNKLEVIDYAVCQMHKSDFIEKNYANPANVRITFPEQKRNLIYIYLESMEVTFADEASGGAFPENAIPELTTLAMENTDFSGNSGKLDGAVSMNDTNWTVAAMFAQTSGLPLKIPVDQNEMVYFNKFFPGVTSLGDILENNGYNNVLMIGSNAEFGGRKNYFTQHGDYEMNDYLWAKDEGLIPQNYKVWWGYEDTKLFHYAENKLRELSKSDEPFNLTILTADTHFEDGHKCPRCPGNFPDNRYADIMNCSSIQVDEFVKWCQRQDWYENTTIVISGDHPTMDKNFCDDVDENYQRKVYTAIINPGAEVEDPDRVREFSTFDHFPTTLAALGCEIDGNRLGLGTNLFSSEDTLLEKYGYEDFNRELKYRSDFMKKLFKKSR